MVGTNLVSSLASASERPRLAADFEHESRKAQSADREKRENALHSSLERQGGHHDLPEYPSYFGLDSTLHILAKRQEYLP